MTVYYDALQASIFLGEQDGVRFIVAPETQVLLIGYLDRSSYQSLADKLPAWVGYGEYKRLSP